MNEASNSSKTALMVCAYRARASARENPLCHDPWAAAISGDEGLALADAFDKAFPHMELWMALRTAYLDAHVHYWTGVPAFRQVVLLGAGFDARAQRLSAPGIRFFEVDHPATQAHKRALVERLPGYSKDAATYVACDFERGQDPVDQLRTAGFDASAPALVIWEGVVPYLSEAAIRETASRIASAMEPRSVLLFDFINKRLGTGGADLGDAERRTRDYVESLQEPLRFGTNDILPLLADCGYSYVRVQNFDELALSFTGTYERERGFRFQSMAVASPTVHSPL